VLPEKPTFTQDEDAEGLDALVQELSRLRKTVLRQGHAQELFQARVEEAVGRLAAGQEERQEKTRPQPAGPSAAQIRALLELDQALLQILRLAAGSEEQEKEEEQEADLPGSLWEGLSLLQIRVRNLQHSMGLEAIPTRRQPFDDRWHEAYAVTHRPDLPDRWIVEEILPGYRLGDRVVRPARVVVNLHS
jgi:molecular chaperone GrpE